MSDRWWTDAACINIEVDGVLLDVHERIALFFPDNERIDGGKAKRICRQCPVKRVCLDDAIAEEKWKESPQGIRGAMTGEERMNERRKRAVRKRSGNGY